MNQKIIVGSCMLLLVVLMPVALASQTNVALTYYPDGNLLTNGDKRYVYDGFNRLSEVFINEMIKEKYWYDPDGQRLKKVKFHGDGSNTTIYYISKSFVGIMNASGTYDEVYYYDEYDLIAKQDAEGKKFYHPDHLGSTTLVTDESGKVVEETVYDPYGAVQEGCDQRFDYEGKETDFSGLQYFGARYYDPGKPKRWTQPDTLLPDVYDPQQLNRYAFERNNPYKHEDKEGHYGEPLTIGIIGILASFFTPELIIGTGLTLLGITLVGHIISTDQAQINTDNPYPGLTGKDYNGKEDWLDNELPRNGEAPFVDPPPQKRGGKKYKYDREGNPVDKNGRSWRPDRTEQHWDRQDPGGGHTRITPDGRILSSLIWRPISGSQRAAINKKSESGGGYSDDVGGYVTKEGRYYPTHNKNWKPKSEK